MFEAASRLPPNRQERFLKLLSKAFTLQVSLSTAIYRFRLPINRRIGMALDQSANLLADIKYAGLLYESKKELEAHLEEARKVETRALFWMGLLSDFNKKPAAHWGFGNCERLSAIAV